MTQNKKQPIIAAINDISGFGRCSLTVALPIISAMNIQVCPLPTAILSNHTGYDEYFFDDYTSKMETYISKWEKLNLHFDGIYSGFLGSEKQIEIVSKFIDKFKSKGTIVVIDPVMGDDGKLYSTYTSELCDGMKNLILKADIITPNITEACFLADVKYKENWSEHEVFEIAQKLLSSQKSPKEIVITGVHANSGKKICNYVFNKNTHEKAIVSALNKGKKYSGTGDVFSSVLVGELTRGTSLKKAVKKAAKFVSKAVDYSNKLSIPSTDGICFEKFIRNL